MKNVINVLGNLGADPELRYANNGNPVCNMRIATNENWTDSNGQRQKHTEWHRIVVWGKNAKNCAQYLKKGRLVDIQGHIRSRKWEDKEGMIRYTTEIIADRVIFLSTGRYQEQSVDSQVPLAEVNPTLSEEAQKIFESSGDAPF